MISETELEQAIFSCEKEPITYSNIEKLAHLYAVQERLYGSQYSGEIKTSIKTIVTNGGSEFLQTVNGMDVEKVLAIINDLMKSLKVINPNLYESVLDKLDT